MKFVLLLICLSFFTFSDAWAVESEPQLQQSSDESIVIRARWRAGDMRRYEFTEKTGNPNIPQEEFSTRSAEIHVDVVGEVSGGYALLWRFFSDDIEFLGEPQLDSLLRILLTDGIVIYTDRMGMFLQIGNLTEFQEHLQHAVRKLQSREYWSSNDEMNSYLRIIDDDEWFEAYLMKDIRFFLGLKGVKVNPREDFKYDTWQENPWGEALRSTGEISTLEFRPDDNFIKVSNTVTADKEALNELAAYLESGGYEGNHDDLVVSESQIYTMNYRTGWIKTLEIKDNIYAGQAGRVRTVTFEEIE